MDQGEEMTRSYEALNLLYNIGCRVGITAPEVLHYKYTAEISQE